MQKNRKSKPNKDEHVQKNKKCTPNSRDDSQKSRCFQSRILGNVTSLRVCSWCIRFKIRTQVYKTTGCRF